MVVALICGGGNGAHVLAGIASSQPETEARVLTLYADEAERWSTLLQSNDYTVKVTSPVGESTVLKSKPAMVTKDPSQAVPGCDVIVITVPAFVHEQYLRAIEPYVQPNMVLVGLPGRAGFRFQVMGIWGKDKSKQFNVISFESLPWACRIKEFGISAEVLGTKDTLHGAIQAKSPEEEKRSLALIQHCLGSLPKLHLQGHIVGLSLMVLGGMVHPSIMFDRWSAWDGKPLDEPPLFYNGLSEAGAGLISAVSDDAITVAKEIMRKQPAVDLSNVEHIYQWYMRCYPDTISDKTNLYTAIQTNGAYQGLKHPTIKTPEGKYMPDFQYRYLAEDVPFGLVVMKGVAELVGAPTPTIDKILLWSQERLGKEYMVGGKLVGKDMNSTRAPQRYGLNTLEAILGVD